MGRFGEKDLISQIDNKAPILKAVASTDADAERVDVFNIFGGFGHAGLQADGGTLISGGAIAPVQGIQVPSIFLTRLQVPRATAKLTKGAKAGVDFMNACVNAASDRLARMMGRALIDPNLGALTAGGATSLNGIADGGTGSIAVNDVSGFRAGDIVGLHDDSAANDPVGEYLLVNSVTPTAGSAAGTINVTRDQHGLIGVADPALFTDAGNEAAAGDFFKIYTPASSTEPVSLAKLATDEDIYGIDVSVDAPFYKGTRVDEAGAFDDASLRALIETVFVSDGEMPGFVLASPHGQSAYVNGLIAQREFRPGEKWDASGKEAWMPEVDGLKMVGDPNCPRTKMFLVPNRADKYQLRWQQRPRPEAHGPVGKGGEKSYAFASSTTYVYDVQIDAMCSVRCQKRTAIGELYGIT